MFVISEVGAGSDTAKRFEDRLELLAKACGFQVSITGGSRLDLDPDEEMRRFAPRHVLVIKGAGGITGAQEIRRFDVRLFEMPETPVWRAQVGINLHYENPPEILARGILNQLRADEFIKPCWALRDTPSEAADRKREARQEARKRDSAERAKSR